MFPSRMESKLFILMSKTLSSPAPSLPCLPQPGSSGSAHLPTCNPCIQLIWPQHPWHQVLARTSSLPSTPSHCVPPSRSCRCEIWAAARGLRPKDKKEPVTGRAGREHSGDGVGGQSPEVGVCAWGDESQGGRCSRSRVEGREVVRAGGPHGG